jgi:carbon-monoxide dehydrogenase medium subunit
MIPAPFDYIRPSSLDEALGIVAERDGARVIAGGQSLLPLLRFRLAQPAMLVDISRLEDLTGVESTGSGIRIGAGTTYRELLGSRIVRERYPVLVELTERIGDRQVRNLGTVGGGLAHADPGADLPAAMVALGARLTLRSAERAREVEASEFFLGPFTTALEAGELLTGIEVPALPGPAAYVGFKQAASGFAIAGAAAVVANGEERIGFTGVSGAPFATPFEAVEEALGRVEVNEDIHASADYRRHLALVAARRAVAIARGRN